MQDYDVHVLAKDIQELNKRGLVVVDSNDCKYVDFQAVLGEAMPKKRVEVEEPEPVETPVEE